MTLQDMEDQSQWLLDYEALDFECAIEGEYYPWVDVGFIEDFDEERLGENPPDPEYGEMIDWCPPPPRLTESEWCELVEWIDEEIRILQRMQAYEFFS